MKKRIKPLALIIVLLGLLGGGTWFFEQNPPAGQALLVRLKLATPPSADLTASGFIKTTQIILSPEVSGRITELAVAEGEPVAAGQVLARLDADLLLAERVEAEAGLEEAKARLALVAAGARPEEIAVVEAAVVMATAQQEATYLIWQDALTLRDQPQELELQIEAARSQLQIAEQRLKQLVPLKDAAELMNSLRERQVQTIEAGRDFYLEIPEDIPPEAIDQIKVPGNVTLKDDLDEADPGDRLRAHLDFKEGAKRGAWAAWNLASTDLWSAWTGVNGAAAAYEAAQQNLDDLLAIRDNAQYLQVRVAQSEAAYLEAGHIVNVAEANLALIKAGATQQQLELAGAAVEQALTALAALDVELEKYTLRAPVGGLILELPVHAGEIARPGMTFLSLGQLDPVDLKVYIPEPRMGQVTLNQEAQLSVDAYPGETFSGRVVWIGAEAEFTPRNVQTAEERASTVFAVKISIPNPEQKLKPGMPADVVLGKFPPKSGRAAAEHDR